MTKTQPAARPPRFELRFNNGTYHVFDRAKWAPIGSAGLRKQGLERVARLNQGRA